MKTNGRDAERRRLDREYAAHEARIEAALPMALRWTGPVAPDVPPPEDFAATTTGLAFNNSYDKGHVFRAWSRQTLHGTGEAPPSDQWVGSRGAQSLYSSELLALRALRHEMERAAARRLAEIDERIAAVEAAGRAGGAR